MSTIDGLTPELDAAVRAELRSGEELWYAGMPSPSIAGRSALPIAVFGMFFGGFALFWMGFATWIMWTATPEGDPGNAPPLLMRIFFPLFGLPFLAVGAGLVSSPWWIARKARRTACCVTSDRAFQLDVGKSVKVRSWGRSEIGEVSKTLHADGSGSVTFAKSQLLNSRGRLRTVTAGFHGIPDARSCEEALLALKPAPAEPPSQ
ncbi:MAG: hypothetical protein LW636_01335 [Planctomycetaceae bacterium]|nr:hypothetical protein [Planctomycetaceae bacterium]